MHGPTWIFWANLKPFWLQDISPVVDLISSVEQLLEERLLQEKNREFLDLHGKYQDILEDRKAKIEERKDLKERLIDLKVDLVKIHAMPIYGRVILPVYNKTKCRKEYYTKF